jgi:hypothetical protein
MAVVFPSVADVQAYARAARAYGGSPSMQPGQAIQAPPLVAGPKPRLKMRNNGEIVILGVDDPAVLFAPLNPLQPIGQDPRQQVVGRPWDYPPGWNTRVTPRTGYEYGFNTLKALADGYDVLRALIERVKDKIVSQPWSILPKAERGQPQKKKDARSQEIEEFLRYPDKMHTWADWARMVLEQVIVYDAPALYLRNTRGGDLYSIEVLDGSMISPKIMADGRLPPPDVGPAYQQVIKQGMPAVDYIQPVPKGVSVPRDPSGFPLPELLYKPRNPRVDSPYGLPVVEQMITTVNIAIRREAFLLGYYTDGATPDLIFTCPSTWTTNDISNFKVWWDSVLSGNLGNRRGTMFVPDGAKPIDTKEKALTDQTDEWLIRVMCFFLGLSPMPFVKMMNRASGEQHHQEAGEEGLAPWQRWFADLFNHLIRIKWGYPDLEFRWEEAEAVNPTEQATIDVALVNAKIYHPDEIRAKRGDDPMADDLRAEMDMPNYNGNANSTVLPPDQQAEADARTQAQNEAKAKALAAVPTINPAAQKAHEIEVAKAGAPTVKVDVAPPAVNVAAPVVNVQPAKIEIAPPAITVNTPAMKAADVFVDVGATNVRVDGQKSVTKTVTVKRTPDGMSGEIRG